MMNCCWNCFQPFNSLNLFWTWKQIHKKNENQFFDCKNKYQHPTPTTSACHPSASLYRHKSRPVNRTCRSYADLQLAAWNNNTKAPQQRPSRSSAPYYCRKAARRNNVLDTERVSIGWFCPSLFEIKFFECKFENSIFRIFKFWKKLKN